MHFQIHPLPNSVMNSGESIENQICNYLEGDLNPEDQADFEAHLAHDSKAIDLLCMHALMDASLKQSTLVAAALPAERLLEKQRRRALGISMASAATVTLIAALILRWIMVPAAESFAQISITPGTAYSIQTKGSAEPDAKLDFGDTLIVSQGIAEIAFADGSRCVAEAPARITLHDRKHAHLSNGQAFFEIAKGSEGFMVTTSDLKIVDLGTAFGIDDRAEHQPQVHVIDGRVRVTTLSGRRETTELHAGEAMAVGGAGTLRPISSTPGKFLQKLPATLSSIRFSFDRTNGSLLTATGSIAEQESVRLLDNPGSEVSPSSSEGIIGQSLRFDRRDQHVETTWQGIGGSTPRTISFWARFPEGSRGGTILGWGLATGSRKMSDLRVDYSGERLANLRLASGRRWLQTTQRLDTGEWHHVAFIIDSPDSDRWPTVKCYINGVLDPVTERVPDEGEVAPLDSFETITDHPDSRPLIFGDSSSPDNQGGGFTGEIDEVVITAGILSKIQIQTLAEAH